MESFHDDPGVRWMLAWQAGDEGAFDRLVEAHAGQLYALAARFLRPEEDREGFVQEVFLRVIRARASYRPTARLSTWLYRIAFNLGVNTSQRAGPGTTRLDERAAPEPVDVTADPTQSLERADVVQAVRAAIAELPDAQRMALVLAKYHDQPYAEIAQVLESSEKAVKSLIHRARETLRARLAPFLERELA